MPAHKYTPPPSREEQLLNELKQMQPPLLEQLDRQLTAALYAVWRAQGKSKRVVEIRQDKDGNTEE